MDYITQGGNSIISKPGYFRVVIFNANVIDYGSRPILSKQIQTRKMPGK
jgi:hypothetical protein